MIHPEFRICKNGKCSSYRDFLEMEHEEAHLKELAAAIQEWINTDHHLMMFTSGSTGPAKEIAIEKERMRASARMTIKYLGLKQGNSSLLCIPLSRIGGRMVLIRAMLLGMRLIVEKPSIHCLDALDTTAIQVASFLPNQVYHFLGQDALCEKFARIKQVLIGGAAIPPQMYRKLCSFHNEIFQSFGMTETISHIALHRIGQQKQDVYTLLPDISIHCDKNQCLCISAPMLSEQIIRTNDLVEILTKNEFRWLGRFDNLINSAGHKMYPEQMEKCIAEQLSNPFFIAALPDDQYGQVPALFIESESPLELNLADLNKKFPPMQRLREIVYLRKFSYAAQRKLNRAETLKRYLST